MIDRKRTKGRKITFASTERIEAYEGLAQKFMAEVFGLMPGEYLITDESDIRDFTEPGASDTSEIWKRIDEVFEVAGPEVVSGRLSFQGLYRELNAELLHASWRDLNKDAASGVDGVTAEVYERDLDANIQDLVRRLKRKRYRAKLVRRCYISKDDGGERPLGIPALEDKLVQLACAKLLNAMYEQDFLLVSYGYRPGRRATDAVTDLAFNLQYGRFGYVVEAEIQGFFDNIDHERLLEMLSERIDDRAFLDLIRKWLKAGILETDGQVLHPETGTPQGGICFSDIGQRVSAPRAGPVVRAGGEATL